MIAQEILSKLDKAIACVRSDNFVENIPQIIEHLKYIYEEMDKDKDELNIASQYLYSSEIRDKVIEFSKELVRQYIKIKYKKDSRFRNVEDYTHACVHAMYNSKNDTIEYANFGLSLGANTKSSYVYDFLHEERHKIQHDSYKEKRVRNILEYSPNMIFLAKETAYEDSKRENKREFYLTNYYSLFYENDAEKFALEELKTMVMDLLNIYKDYASKKNIRIDQNIQYYATIIAYDMIMDSAKLKKEFARKEAIINESQGLVPITSSYIVDGQEIDRLIEIDKYIKNHPELQETMPIFKLIFKGNIPKTYEEIIEDKLVFEWLYELEGLSKSVEKLYECIIMSDPILYLTDLVVKNKKEEIIEFLSKHQTLSLEYPQEMRDIIDKCNDEEIIDILINFKFRHSKK